MFFFLSSLPHRRCLLLCLLPLPFWGHYMENKATNIKLPALFTALIFGRWRSAFSSLFPSFLFLPLLLGLTLNIWPQSERLGVNRSFCHTLVSWTYTPWPRCDVWRCRGGVWFRNWGCACFCSSSLEYWTSWAASSPLLASFLYDPPLHVSRAPANVAWFPSAPRPPARLALAVCHRAPFLIRFPHHSHVSLMYFLVAIIALSSSTHRVPRCSPFPPTLISALHFCLLCTLNWCWVHGDSWDVFPSLLSSGLEIKRWC